MKTFTAIVKFKHCGKDTPAVLNRLTKMEMNAMDLFNDCNYCDKSLNQKNESGESWTLVKCQRNFMPKHLVDEN